MKTQRTFEVVLSSFHDIRAVVVELAYNLDALRNADELEPIRNDAGSANDANLRADGAR